jgi:hypothetical protein
VQYTQLCVGESAMGAPAAFRQGAKPSITQKDGDLAPGWHRHRARVETTYGKWATTLPCPSESCSEAWPGIFSHLGFAARETAEFPGLLSITPTPCSDTPINALAAPLLGSPNPRRRGPKCALTFWPGSKRESPGSPVAEASESTARLSPFKSDRMTLGPSFSLPLLRPTLSEPRWSNKRTLAIPSFGQPGCASSQA